MSPPDKGVGGPSELREAKAGQFSSRRRECRRLEATPLYSSSRLSRQMNRTARVELPGSGGTWLMSGGYGWDEFTLGGTV